VGGDTTVTITTGAGSWSHRANGLDDASREDGARGRLAEFVAWLEHWDRAPRRPAAREIRPTALRVLALPVSETVRDPVAVHRLTTSGQRYYRQSGTSYELAAAVLLPGDSCDPRGAS
jgi:hypothetical protein